MSFVVKLKVVIKDRTLWLAGGQTMNYSNHFASETAAQLIIEISGSDVSA